VTWRLGNDCSDGRTKYFDAKQRLKKEAVAEYCGEAVYK
jgi:hypothetical protein